MNDKVRTIKTAVTDSTDPPSEEFLNAFSSALGIPKEALVEFHHFAMRLREKGILIASVFAKASQMAVIAKTVRHAVAGGDITDEIPFYDVAAYYNFGKIGQDTPEQSFVKSFLHGIALEKNQSEGPHSHQETEEHYKEFHPEEYKKMKQAGHFASKSKPAADITKDDLKKMDPENDFKN